MTPTTSPSNSATTTSVVANAESSTTTWSGVVHSVHGVHAMRASGWTRDGQDAPSISVVASWSRPANIGGGCHGTQGSLRFGARLRGAAAARRVLAGSARLPHIYLDGIA